MVTCLRLLHPATAVRTTLARPSFDFWQRCDIVLHDLVVVVFGAGVSRVFAHGLLVNDAGNAVTVWADSFVVSAVGVCTQEARVALRDVAFFVSTKGPERLWDVILGNLLIVGFQ